MLDREAGTARSTPQCSHPPRSPCQSSPVSYHPTRNLFHIPERAQTEIPLHLDKVIPFHRWPALLCALVRSQDLSQKPCALPVHIFEPSAEVPLLLSLLLRCAGNGLLLTTEARKETLLHVLILDRGMARRFRTRLDLDLLFRQVLRLQIRMSRLRAALFQ